ncbi:AAA family ATPase [Candidatus Dependentiae bacterium]|nr:AAA family ATPase [Candidatus Dependentiae bacterium]
MKASGLKKMLLIIEGNIGAGKSTFLKILKKHLDLDIIHEPTNKWQNISEDGNILDLFYKDTRRWAYTFQSFAFVTRVQSIQDALKKNTKDLQVLERSVYCDRFCFAKNCYESGTMSALEWQIYKNWFSWLVQGYTKRPDAFVYLKADPEVCYLRMKKRSRKEEDEVTLSYLKNLHKKHEDWLIDKKETIGYIKNVPILTLDCNSDFENNKDKQEKHVKAVMDFINEIKGKYIIPAKQKQIQL